MENLLAYCGFQSSICLILSAALLACVLLHDEVAGAQLGWSKSAAIAAEQTASHHCSGHGFIFTDTLPGPNQSSPVCECNACFESDTCAVKKPYCLVNVRSFEPGFLEPFWITNAETSSFVVPSWYRMSYDISDESSVQTTPELDYWIRSLHELVGNAVVKNKYIVVGAGASNLISAAFHSLSYSNYSSSEEYMKNQSLAVASAPYYFDFRTQTQTLDSIRFRWGGDSKKYVHQTEGKKFVEVITNPNNPDGYPQRSILKGDVKVVSDRVAWWPHYTPITEAADDDVMLFSLSKLTGHSGTRFGWALVKDKAVYKRMKKYVHAGIGRESHDAQFRATALLRTIVKGYQNNISDQKMFDFGYNELRRRWTKIADLFSQTDRFTLQNTTSNYCNFFEKVMQPAKAFAWVTCNWDQDCTKVFLDAGIQAKHGPAFEGNLNQARLSLMKRSDNFEMLYEKLKSLIEGSSAYVQIMRGSA